MLWQNQLTPCTVILRESTPDGCGGYSIKYTDGDKFNAAFALESASRDLTAAKPEEQRTYILTFDPSISPDFFDLIRRESDQKIFRVVSAAYDRRTPKSSALNMRQVIAEEVPCL